MFPGFDLSKLPSLSLSQRNALPECPAVYFAVDSKNRVLYVGRATNLLARWKDHHRQEQLNRINRRNKIKIAWLICPSELKILVTTEIYFIGLYQPLLNRTPVPAKTIIPAETVLQLTLRKLASLDVVVFGFEPAMDSFPPTVYLKYSINIYRKTSISNVGSVNKIIQATNKKKSTGLKWREYKSRKYSHYKIRSWKTGCNGVNIDLSIWELQEDGYWLFRLNPGGNTGFQTVAGVEMPTLNESGLASLFNKFSWVREQYPRVLILKHDPIPLLWSKH